MNALRKWWKLAVAVTLAVVALQIGASLLVRTHRVHAYLVAHLKRSFGRPVEVSSFGVRLVPILQLYADGVTVGEAPSFGYEYFLRAEHLSASARWSGLLRGHFEFGTLSFSKPSLILVRNFQGHWNLEQWLPPAKTNYANDAHIYGPPAPAPPVNRLERIEFDEGRINFKNQDDKLAFAFTGVSGSVEQVSRGRWQLQLKAQPWRSGVPLQSAGTIRVRGDLAGTSARLQPAQITLHWSEASLADVFRLFRGQDYGARGLFALDATAGSTAAKDDGPGDWAYTIQGRGARIHRWDLTERPDNPALNLNVSGRWNIGKEALVADQISVEAPRSNLRGQFHYPPEGFSALELRLDSMGVQASDLLAWYRAFHGGVADGVTAEQYYTGGMILRGWPLSVESAAVSSSAGTIKIPGFSEPIRVGPVNGGRERSSLVIGPVRVALGGDARDVLAPKKRRVASIMDNAADLTFTQDLTTHAGTLSVEGNISKVEDFLRLGAALGRPLNHGWELSGHAVATTQWIWKEPFGGLWSGSVSFNKASLTVAGLNQPLHLLQADLNWTAGRRSAQISKAEGFGGTWTGTMSEKQQIDASVASVWKFDLAVDHLNAAELDRWVGPRARPNWLQRLLQSFTTEGTPAALGSELLRRVNAEGQVRITRLTIEKLKLENVLAQGSLRDLKLELQDAQAEWAGGQVRAKISASFLPRPSYDIAADLDRVDLAKLPGTGRLAGRLGGAASGKLELKTAGVGREELLRNLDGHGVMNLKKVELRGWDLPASLADGATHTGTSRWPSGESRFLIRDRSVVVQWLQLNAPFEQTSVRGTLSFSSDADLSITTRAAQTTKAPWKKPADKEHVLKISGPLDGPHVTVEKSPEQQIVN